MNTQKQKMGKLVLTRHHESEWNKLGKWTGITNVHLTENGFEKSKEMESLIKDIYFDYAFISELIRTQETLTSMLTGYDLNKKISVIKASELNERDYGDYTGKNKWEVKKVLGEEKFNKLRRGWNYAVPNGETLKMVYERAVPFYIEKILPLIKEGKNILVVSHGNTIRALEKYIENISDTDVAKVEMIFGSVLIYDVDNEGHIIDKEVREL